MKNVKKVKKFAVMRGFDRATQRRIVRHYRTLSWIDKTEMIAEITPYL